MRRALLVLVAFVSVQRAAWPQGGNPLGPEFRVNTYTTGNQYRPAVASDASGNFVVVPRYPSSGPPLGPEFRVNTFTTSNQLYPSVAADSLGNFIVVWTSLQDGFGYGIFGQRYASSGAPLGPEFRVNTYTTGNQSFPSIVSDSSGNFVVVWASHQDDGFGGVVGQRYASSGAPLGPEFRVNTYTTGYQASPSIVSDSSGNFVVVWNSYTQDGSGMGVFGQRYAGSGVPLGPEFRVNTYTTGAQSGP